MLEQQDLQQIRGIVQDVVGVTEKKLDGRIGTVDYNLDGFIAIVNQGFSDVQRSIEGTNKRIDKLYSLVDGFIALHQKLDQELTMLRAKIDRQEEEIQQIKVKLAMV